MVILSFCCNLPLYAIELKYSVHTSLKDIELKKKKSLEWYEDNVNKNKFYSYDINKHIDFLKNRAVGWYENAAAEYKFYFVNSSNELETLKNKSLRWYEHNSQ